MTHVDAATVRASNSKRTYEASLRIHMGSKLIRTFASDPRTDARRSVRWRAVTMRCEDCGHMATCSVLEVGRAHPVPLIALCTGCVAKGLEPTSSWSDQNSK